MSINTIEAGLVAHAHPVFSWQVDVRSLMDLDPIFEMTYVFIQ